MKLTEEVVLQRTKAKSLDEVRSLNMWGQDISDIDVLLHMPNVEVLSLSVNSISSLSGIRKCHRLRELYLRKNDVRNLADIQYLASIESLKILWLSDNPCADAAEYRATVVQYLPHLEKLDNVDVSESERLGASAGALMLPKLDTADSLERDLVLDAPTPAPAQAPVHPPPAARKPSFEQQQQHPVDPRGIGLPPPQRRDGGPYLGDPQPPQQGGEPSGSSRVATAAERPRRVGGGDDAAKVAREMVNTSPNVLYAVIALLEELDEDSLRIVKAEIDSKLKSLQ